MNHIAQRHSPISNKQLLQQYDYKSTTAFIAFISKKKQHTKQVSLFFQVSTQSRSIKSGSSFQTQHFFRYCIILAQILQWKQFNTISTCFISTLRYRETLILLAPIDLHMNSKFQLSKVRGTNSSHLLGVAMTLQSQHKKKKRGNKNFSYQCKNIMFRTHFWKPCE